MKQIKMNKEQFINTNVWINILLADKGFLILDTKEIVFSNYTCKKYAEKYKEEEKTKLPETIEGAYYDSYTEYAKLHNLHPEYVEAFISNREMPTDKVVPAKSWAMFDAGGPHMNVAKGEVHPSKGYIGERPKYRDQYYELSGTGITKI